MTNHPKRSGRPKKWSKTHYELEASKARCLEMVLRRQQFDVLWPQWKAKFVAHVGNYDLAMQHLAWNAFNAGYDRHEES